SSLRTARETPSARTKAASSRGVAGSGSPSRTGGGSGGRWGPASGAGGLSWAGGRPSGAAGARSAGVARGETPGQPASGAIAIRADPAAVRRLRLPIGIGRPLFGIGGFGCPGATTGPGAENGAAEGYPILADRASSVPPPVGRQGGDPHASVGPRPAV